MLIFNEQMQQRELRGKELYSRNDFNSEESENPSLHLYQDLNLDGKLPIEFKYPDDPDDIENENKEQIEETVMPVEFYQNVDTFLSNRPPKLKRGQSSLPFNDKSSHALSTITCKSTIEKKKPTVSATGLFVTAAEFIFSMFPRHYLKLHLTDNISKQISQHFLLVFRESSTRIY